MIKEKKSEADPLKIIITVIILVVVLVVILFAFRNYFGQEVAVINKTLANISQSVGGWFD